MVRENYSQWTLTQLIEEIKKLKKRKKYGLVWDTERDPEKVVTDCKEKLPVLIEDNKKEIENNNSNSVNILIEGDNYHALSVLNYTHKGKIDVIYIDPPYNTGSAGFIYNDKIIDLNDSYRHSKWLSFMAKRLQLAKNLLKKQGIIFISIDDNEIARLKLLCDEIFGDNNFVSQIIIQTNKGGRDYLPIATTHEYLLCYGKSEDIILNELPKDMTLFEMKDTKGLYEVRELRNRNPKFTKANRPNLYYPLYINSKLKDQYGYCAISLTKSKEYKVETFPKNSEGKDSCWRWGKPLTSKNIIFNNPKESEVVAKQKKDGGWNIYEKSRKFTTKAKSIWDETQMRTELGTIILRNIFGKPVFDHPKPVPLIKKILQLASSKDSIILDFMAGSGTTGHAVLDLNKDDGGNRKFILCTNNENNICSEVCLPRMEKIMRGYTGKVDGKKYLGLGGSLKYFKTNFVDAEPTDLNKKNLVDNSTEMLCLKESCFEKIKKGVEFSIFKNDNNKYLGIVYDDEGIDDFKKEVKKLNKKFIVYMFSLDESAREEEFEDVKRLVELKPIPAVILNVYKRIFK